MKTLNEELTSTLKSAGASLVGFADLSEINSKARNNFPFGISIAVALKPNIIASIKDGPNRPYYEEYKRANHILDMLGHHAAEFLKHRGHKANSYAATNTGIDWDTLSTTLPHKTVATRAGLGWIGKCALLVTKDFGSAVRLTTVLTDAPIAGGEAIDSSACGECTDCVNICPSHAISGNVWQAGTPRESLYDAFACRETARNFQKTRNGIHHNICGMCIVACPWTQKYLKKAI
jgi:epoxyqueuosine reductase QueG